MNHPETIDWSLRARQTVERYRDDLLRQVAAKLLRPRSHRSTEELLERMTSAWSDPAVLDKTLKSVAPVSRQLLKLLARSGQPRWPLQSLADLLPLMGHADGIGPVRELLGAGLLLPELSGTLPVESFDSWLSVAGSAPLAVFALPLAAERCLNEPLPLEGRPGDAIGRLAGQESDGFEWLLRLAVLWQVVREAPLRLTQSGGFFKRDLDRLRAHPLLSTAVADAPATVADLALLTVALGRAVGVIDAHEDELVAGSLPASWAKGHGPAIREIWSGLFAVDRWEPVAGFDAEPKSLARWRPIAAIIAEVLAESPAENWIAVDELATWLSERVEGAPDLSDWVAAILLGLWYALRIVETAKSGESYLVRLSSLGRQVLSRVEPILPKLPVTQTLLVQPNLEVILFRQGLTPELTDKITRMAEWKTLGLACTLQLTANSVYRGLESGMSLADVTRTLERHSTRSLPDSVLETLRSWASKRERVQVYPNAVLLEFRTCGELEAAIKQGLVDQAITDRIGLVPSDDRIDWSRFRLAGTRDYQAPDERCVEVLPDGLTLSVQDGKADLMLGAELRRIAKPLDIVSDERSQYRMSLESLRAARASGTDLRWLDDWFLRRSGLPVPAAAHLLFQGEDAGQNSVSRLIVLRMSSEEAADGLAQWPDAQSLLSERLGPTTFVIEDEKLPLLKRLLESASLSVVEG